jgi:hypothetical protein
VYRTIAIIAGAGAALVACSSSGSQSSDVPRSQTATLKTVPLTSATTVQAQLTYGTDIHTILSQLGCLNASPYPSPTDSSGPDLGIKFTDDQACTFDGKPLEVSTLADTAQETHALTVFDGLLHSAGVIGYIAVGDGWIAGLDVDEDQFKNGQALQKDIAGKIVAKIGGKVRKFG